MGLPTNQIDVLDAIVDRLRSQLPDVTESTCFLTAEPPDEVPPNVRSDWFVTVSPGSGLFNDSDFAGGGVQATYEETEVVVGLYSKVKLDRVGHDESALMLAGRGLLALKHEVLKALCGFRPADDSAREVVGDEVAPRRADVPRTMWSSGRPSGARLLLTFAVNFDWNLS